MEKATLKERVLYTLSAGGSKSKRTFRYAVSALYLSLICMNIFVIVGGSISGANVIAIIVNAICFLVNCYLLITLFKNWENSDLRKESWPDTNFKYVRR